MSAPRLGLIGLGKQGQRYLDPKNGGMSIEPLTRHGLTLEVPLEDIANVDAVIIATPAETHADIAIRCLEAGKPVLVEKPLATTLADCMRVIDTAERLRLPLLVGHTHLFAEPWRSCPSNQSIIVRLEGPTKLPAYLDWGSHGIAMALDCIDAPVSKGVISRHINGPQATWNLSFENGTAADVIVVNAIGLRRRQAYVLDWKYEPDAPCHHTALWHQVDVFKRMIAGEPDRRGSYDFTRSVYRTLFGELS